MTSAIGSKYGEAGFALYEVLLAVVIMSGGLVLVFQPLLGSARALRHAEGRLEGGRLLANELWHLEEEAVRTSAPSALSLEESLPGAKRFFQFRSRVRVLSRDRRLLGVDAEISWPNGSRSERLPRSVYVLLPSAANG